jgi:hypothetical protein
MKLARNTEWAVIGALILYIAFTPGFRVIKDLLATPVGKALALGAIVYVWKYVSPIIAILLTISFMRCAKWNVWEMFSGAEVACTCENGAAIWDPQSKTCKDATGNVAGPVKTCTCSNGYAWDGGEKGTKQCIPITSDQPPVPPATNPTADALVGTTLGASAPTTGGTAAPSAVPETTGSAAAQTMASLPPMPPASGGAQPGAGATSGPASV